MPNQRNRTKINILFVPKVLDILRIAFYINRNTGGRVGNGTFQFVFMGEQIHKGPKPYALNNSFD